MTTSTQIQTPGARAVLSSNVAIILATLSGEIERLNSLDRASVADLALLDTINPFLDANEAAESAPLAPLPTFPGSPVESF
jgi:hypothetical protein